MRDFLQLQNIFGVVQELWVGPVTLLERWKNYVRYTILVTLGITHDGFTSFTLCGN